MIRMFIFTVYLALVFSLSLLLFGHITSKVETASQEYSKYIIERIGE